MDNVSGRSPSQRSFAPDPKHQHRVTVFGEARGPWRDSFAEAKWDAIQADLASWDEEAGEHYLAVPVATEKQLRADVPDCSPARP